MKTQTIHSKKFNSGIACIIFSATVSIGALADNSYIDTNSMPQLISRSNAINHGIFSYPGGLPSFLAENAKIIYVDKANGPAIYSYHHSGTETEVSWNVEYTDQAYGQNIYSYETREPKEVVNLLPLKITD